MPPTLPRPAAYRVPEAQAGRGKTPGTAMANGVVETVPAGMANGPVVETVPIRVETKIAAGNSFISPPSSRFSR